MILGILFFGICAFAIGYAIYWNYRNRNANSLQLNTQKPVEDALAQARILQMIRKADPQFSLDQLINRTKEIFFRVQDAWSSGDMSPVRNFLSQGVYNRFKIQLEIMRNVEGLKNMMTDVEVVSVTPISASLDSPYITIHIAINAKGRDVILPIGADDDEARRVLQDAAVSNFTEIYSFTRKPGAQSDSSRDLLKGQCPRCGFVPENFFQVNKCPGCGALYNSGEYDWVLSEITQREEWKSSSAVNIAGLTDGMSCQVIEDRASYLFWRWIQSRVRGSMLPLRRDATEKMIQKIDSVAQEYLGDVAVGAVDLRCIESDDEKYMADVLIRWSASLTKGEEPIHFDHQLYMVLPTGKNVENNFADHGCVQCGAPLPDTDALTCAYCGAELPEINNDWLLDEVNEISRG